MDDNTTVSLTQEETQTYLHLGIIATCTGRGASIYQARKLIAEGQRDPNSDIGALFAQQGFSDEELSELYGFRNSLLHGFVFVHHDGTVEIFDEQEGKLTYTADQIRQYAGRYYNLRLENHVTGSAR